MLKEVGALYQSLWLAGAALGIAVCGLGTGNADAFAETLFGALDLPNGLSAIGFTGDDIQPLVEGTLPQHRVTKLSPRPAEAEDLAQMFEETMTIW